MIDNGIRIYSEPSDAILEKDALIAPIGQRVFVSVKKTFISQNRWYCLKDFQFPKLAVFDRYQMSSCIVECFWNKTAEECGCVEVNTLQQMYEFYGNVCEPLHFTKCLWNQTNFVHKNVGGCSLKCRPECEVVTYEMRQTNAEVKKTLAFSLQKMFEINSTTDVWIEIFFPSITYTHIEESPKFTIDSIVSDFGGQVRYSVR